MKEKLENIEKAVKPESFGTQMKIEQRYLGLFARINVDLGQSNEADTRFILKWESLNAYHDRQCLKPWMEASQLYLYKLKKE